jgi:hypothetical protein
MSKTKKIILAIAAVFVLIWVFAFGLDSDPGCTVTGFDAIGQLSTEFWLWLVGLWGLGAFIVLKSVAWYKRNGYNPGNTLLFGLALLFIIPTLKAYDVKANCGTTGTKGNPANQQPKDDGRESAEDQLKRADTIKF